MERMTTDREKIFIREAATLNSVSKDDIRIHYNELFDRLQELEVLEEQGRLVVLKSESHQPAFIKGDATDIFDTWNDITGAIPHGSSWYYEAIATIEEIAAMAFGAGMMYQNEAQAAIKKMEARP